LAQSEDTQGVDTNYASQAIIDDPIFRSIIENAQQGILINVEFMPFYANQYYCDLFGYETLDEILALPSILDLVSEPTGPNFRSIKMPA